MKFHPPPKDKPFACIIDDCDGDEPFVSYHETQEIAELHAKIQYSNDRGETFPDSTEPGGNTYAEGERPNARVLIVQVLSQTTL
jgi:hypothetical protein